MSLTFDEMAASFDRNRRLPANALRHLVALAEELGGRQPMAICEPGIGTGRISLPLAMAGHEVSGVDLSPGMLETCRSHAAEHGIAERVHLAVGDATSLPWSAASFDLGIIAQLLYLVDDWPAVLDELTRVVRPGGSVLLIRERTEESPALRLWSVGWRTRIERSGYRHMAMRPSEADEVLVFRDRYDDVRLEPLASWSFGQTVRDARKDYAARLRPLYRAVPDDAFAIAVDRFLDWVRGQFRDPDQVLGGTVVLEALIGRRRPG